MDALDGIENILLMFGLFEIAEIDIESRRGHEGIGSIGRNGRVLTLVAGYMIPKRVVSRP